MTDLFLFLINSIIEFLRPVECGKFDLCSLDEVGKCKTNQAQQAALFGANAQIRPAKQTTV